MRKPRPQDLANMSKFIQRTSSKTTLLVFLLVFLSAPSEVQVTQMKGENLGLFSVQMIGDNAQRIQRARRFQSYILELSCFNKGDLLQWNNFFSNVLQSLLCKPHIPCCTKVLRDPLVCVSLGF